MRTYKKSKCTICRAEIDYVGDRPCDFCSQPKPEVGMGVTYSCHTDRHAATIIEVSKSGKTIKVQDDIATRTDKNGMSECQTYSYKPNPEGKVMTFKATTRRGRKAWRNGVYHASVGHRRAYHDFSY